MPLSAFAVLGGAANSAPSAKIQLHAQSRTSSSNGYTIHTTVTETNVNVREYVSAQGIVFAVAWDGPFLPNLAQWLGAYFPAFKSAAKARRDEGIQGPVAIRQDDLVVQSGGHMRAYKGRAYVPSLIPPQVSIDEIR
jgi:hypothetical protein